MLSLVLFINAKKAKTLDDLMPAVTLLTMSSMWSLKWGLLLTATD